MHKKIKIAISVIVIFFTTFTTLNSYANSRTNEKNKITYTAAVDSFLNLIENTSGPEILKIYPSLHSALYEINDFDIHIEYNQQFANAARKNKDK